MSYFSLNFIHILPPVLIVSAVIGAAIGETTNGWLGSIVSVLLVIAWIFFFNMLAENPPIINGIFPPSISIGGSSFLVNDMEKKNATERRG